MSDLCQAAGRPETADLAAYTLNNCLDEMREIRERAVGRLQRIAFWRASSDVWMLLTRDGILLDCNRGLEVRTCRSRAELRGTCAFDFGGPRRDWHASVAASVLDLGRPLAYELASRWGRCEVLVQPINPDFGPEMVMVLMRFWETGPLDPNRAQQAEEAHVIE